MEVEEVTEIKFWRFIVKEIPIHESNVYLRQELLNLLQSNQHKLNNLRGGDQISVVSYIYEEYFLLFLNDSPFNILEVANERYQLSYKYTDDIDSLIELRISAFSLYTSHILWC